MNLADYLSELLGQHEEVALPGLGYFVRERVSGYYSDKEARFYPPHHQVRFVPELKDDDTFAEYVAKKKNISLASSKYFAEKFVVKLKEDAAKSSYIFSDLGSFVNDGEGLVFKPNVKLEADPQFYGYAPVSISKAGQPPRPESVQPIFDRREQVPEEHHSVHTKTLRQLQQEQYLEEEQERRRSFNIWWIALIVVSVLALTVFGIYKFYPATFKRFTGSYHKMFTKDKALLPPVHKAVIPDSLNDTLLKATPTDTSKTVLPADTSKAASVPDTANLSRFEIIVASFRTLPSATVERDRYEAHNVTAKIITDAPGPLLKVSVGTYLTKAEAETARTALIKSGKIPKDSGILQIKPHK